MTTATAVKGWTVDYPDNRRVVYETFDEMVAAVAEEWPAVDVIYKGRETSLDLWDGKSNRLDATALSVKQERQLRRALYI